MFRLVSVFCPIAYVESKYDKMWHPDMVVEHKYQKMKKENPM